MTSMDICSSTSLSWDGVLCVKCRAWFDERIVRRSRQELSARNMFWHNYPTTCRCARLSCRLCTMALQATEQCPNFASLLERGPTIMNDTYLDFDILEYPLLAVKVLVKYEAPGMAWKTLPNDHASGCVLYFQPVYGKNLCVILYKHRLANSLASFQN